MNMGERIRELRKEKGVTQEELGKIIGVRQSAIRKYESGMVENIPRISIQKMADFFDVSPAYLMCFTDEAHITHTESVYLSPDEKSVILSYRKQPDMQTAVKKLLGIEKQPKKKLSPTVSDIKPAQKTYIVRTAGRGEGVKDVEMTEEEIEFYKNLPDVDETDL